MMQNYRVFFLATIVNCALVSIVSASRNTNTDAQDQPQSSASTAQVAPQDTIDVGYLREPVDSSVEKNIAYNKRGARICEMGKFIAGGFSGAGVLPLILTGYPYQLLVAQGILAGSSVVFGGFQMYFTRSAANIIQDENQWHGARLKEVRIGIPTTTDSDD